MKLIAYTLYNHKLNIRPATVERSWMNNTSHRFAYRCLPLNIANSHGWEILCSSDLIAFWNGGKNVNAIHINGSHTGATSHFGHGILTFHVPAVFRTDPGYDLYVTGPINTVYDGIMPLTGVVETDWLPFTFTMNWLFTRVNHNVIFKAGEPFCHIFPVSRSLLPSVEPEIRHISSDPELQKKYAEWNLSRKEFNESLNTPNLDPKRTWQKHYQQGKDANKEEIAPDDHRTKIKLKSFMEMKD